MLYNVLLQELLRLQEAFADHQIPLLIGGGMGLYLRATFYPHPSQPRYPIPVPGRSTDDLDVFLSAELIADAAIMDQIRDALSALGYLPHTPYFQFEKTVFLSGQKRTVKVDLLAAPPHPKDQSRVKINRPRIRPLKSRHIHGYLTDEARGIDRNSIALAVPHPDGRMRTIYIPSSFKYLILKLHAFHDRKDDPSSDYGRHHALDLFRIVIDMTPTDWIAAQTHYADEHDQPYVQQARHLQQTHFGTQTALGLIRLQENKTYQQRRADYAPALPHFIEDLADLFS